MKIASSFITYASCVLSTAVGSAFVVAPSLRSSPKQSSTTSASSPCTVTALSSERTSPESSESSSSVSRSGFLQSGALAAIAGSSSSWLLLRLPAAEATGRATLEQAYRRYTPRIRAGGEFYQTELKQLVQKSDWQGIQNALREVPERAKGDLNKPDAGVAQRARLAGGFSDARVLVAADLFASAFSSQNAITPKTKSMKEAVAKLRTIVAEMEATTKQALGQDGGGGFFGFGGKKKVNEAELMQKMRALYAEGGNAWNEYIFAANDELALQFDRFDYVK
ncbi:hypothetical protein ACA910_017914 [Epithemia clementina (nom. ined.)]